MGGSQPDRAYRRFVESGIDQPPKNPLDEALDSWLLGSEAFLARVRSILKEPQQIDQVPNVRVLRSLSAPHVIESTAK